MTGRILASVRQWAEIEHLLATSQLGARRVDDRRATSGIIRMLRDGGAGGITSGEAKICLGLATTGREEQEISSLAVNMAAIN